jgi:hypothetical protein
MSNVGLWEGWHTAVKPFGATNSYELGAEWLADCEKVEDWGAGAGFLSTLIGPDRYIGVDGSPGPRTDVIADLAEYRSEVPGIFMRHVLEHNYEWAKVLDNALASFTERMFLVLFTPLAPETHDTEFEDPPGVPNLSFALDDIYDVTKKHILSFDAPEPLGNAMPYGLREPKQVGTETVFRLSK